MNRLFAILAVWVAGVAVGAEVPEGRSVYARRFGFDPEDATEAIRKAIDSGATRVIVENVGKPWIVRPIRLRSNLELVLEEGTVILAKEGEFTGRNDCLFSASGCQDLSIIGPGATLRMRKADYQSADYEKSEWRHCLSIRSCRNVKVYGLTLAESGGDGIYLGTAERGVTNLNVHIRDVVCDANHRQGISVITAEDLLIENTVVRNTSGTAPEAGIDFEPNRADERLVNCVMRNCLSEGNAGSGFTFYLKNLTGESEPVSVRFENCRATGNGRDAFAWTVNGGDSPTRGTGEFMDCVFENTPHSGIGIRDNRPEACRLRFARCTVRAAGGDDPEAAPIRLGASTGGAEAVGGIEFDSCTVEDDVDRPPVTFDDWQGNSRPADITGTLLLVRDGTATKVPLTPQTLAAWMPYTALRAFPHIDVDPASLTAALPPGAAEPGPSVRVRGTAEYLFHTVPKQPVEFEIAVETVGATNRKPCPVRVVAPSGETAELRAVPAGASETRRFVPTERGAHRLVCEPGSNTVTVRSATPIVHAGDRIPLHVFRSRPAFLLRVPAGTGAFAVRLAGSNLGERVRAKLVDAEGIVRAEKDSIARAQQLDLDRDNADREEIFTLRIEPPTEGILEDYTIRVLGIPPLLATRPGDILTPAD